jgi:hypothetical protein
MDYEVLKRLELQEACNRLKKAMDAQRVEVYKNAITRKGSTLFSVNRSRNDGIITAVIL